MKVYHPEFEEMHKQMRSWIARQEAEDREVPPAADTLTRWLWSMARTKELGPVMFRMLNEYTDAFEQTRNAG